MERSVLVIGANQRTLDETVAGLRDLGYAAEGTRDFSDDVTARFDVARLDLVSLGGLVPAERKAGLRARIGAINPRTIVIDSLAGIPGLIAGQVQEAFTADRRVPGQTPVYRPEDRSIRLTLAAPAAVTVTVWWRVFRGLGPGSDSLVLLDGRLDVGEHRIGVPDKVLASPRRLPGSFVPRYNTCATVRIDAATYNFGIAPG